jgi:hypothetical protein
MVLGAAGADREDPLTSSWDSGWLVVLSITSQGLSGAALN